MNMNTYMRYGLISLLFTTLIVPLIFANSLFFPFITGKAFLFRALIEVAVALYIILLVRDRSYLPKKSAVMWSVVAFLVVMGLATITSEYPYKSFWSNFERMEGFVSLLHLGAYFVMMGAVFNTKKLWSRFLHASLWMSLIVGFEGLLDLKNGIDTRIYGTLGNSTYLGVYALIHIFLAGFFLIRILERNTKSDNAFWRNNMFYIIVAIYNLVVMYYTGTRGSFVGLLAGVVVIALILAIFERQKKYLRFIGIASLVAIVAALLFLGAIKNTGFAQSSPTLNRYSSLVTFNVGKVIQDQGYGRTLLWTTALQGIKERPVLGWGQDNFNYIFAKYYTPNLYGQEQWFDRAHNVFLDWLVAGGALGLIAYLSMFATFLWYVLRLPDESLSKGEKAVLTGLVVAYSVHNLFVFDHLVSYLLFFALIAYMHRLAVLARSEKDDHRPLLSNEGAQYAVGGIAIVVMIWVLYVVTIKPLYANLALIDSLKYQAAYTDPNSGLTKDPAALNQAYDSYVEALSYNSFGTPEIREQLIIATEGVFAQDPQVQQKALKLAVTEMSAQIARTPKDPRYYYFMAGLYMQLHDYVNALPYIQQSEALSPGKQAFQFLEGEVYINQKKFDQGFAVFKKVYESEPDYPEAQILYAVAGVYDSKPMVVGAMIAKNPAVLLDQRVLQAYVVTKQFSSVIPLLQADLARQQAPNVQEEFFLAAAYLEIGERGQALTTLNDLKKSSKDTQVQSEVDYLVGLINKGATSLINIQQ